CSPSAGATYADVLVRPRPASSVISVQLLIFGSYFLGDLFDLRHVKPPYLSAVRSRQRFVQFAGTGLRQKLVSLLQDSAGHDQLEIPYANPLAVQTSFWRSPVPANCTKRCRLR